MSSLRGMSWQVMAVLGLALLALALQLSATGQRIEAQRAAARASGQPAAIALADFRRVPDIRAADEVHIIARLDPAAVMTVTERTKNSTTGYTTSTRRLYLLADPSDPPDTSLVRAAILLPDAEVGRFLALLTGARVHDGGDGRIVRLNGTRKVAPPLAAPAVAAMRGLGMQVSSEFIFLEPYLEGREAALADQAGSWRWLVGGVASLGAALLVISIAKRAGFVPMRRTGRHDVAQDDW